MRLRSSYRILALLLASLLMPAGFSLSAARAAADGTDSRYRFRHITNQNGLKYTWIWNIDQDSHGYLWFSTMYGTYRYDGYEFEEYAFSNRRNGTAANVTFVKEDAAGDLWFGTDDGLYRHNRRYNTYTCYASSEESPCRLSSDDVLCMDETADGALWVGTCNGLNRIDPARNTCTVVPPPSEGFPAITAVICRRDGTVWFGDNGGSLWRMGEGGECERIPLTGSHHAVKALAEDGAERLWAATEGSGLFRVDAAGTAEHFSERQGTLSNDIVRALGTDRDGKMWAGTEKGITIFPDTGTEFLYSRENDMWGLNDNAVYSLCRDRDGTMWVGTFFGGVNVMNDRYGMFADLVSASGRNELKGCAVSSITSVGDRIYIGTENRGLFVYDTATSHFRNYNSRNSGLNNDNVHAVCIDDRKNLWVGNFYGGLNRMRPGESAFNRNETGAATPSNSVYSLLQDGADNLWAGTFYDGLFRYDYASERFERFAAVPSWVFVWDILEDYKGNIWLACYGEGIFKLDRSRNYEPVHIETGARKYVTLCELADGRILAGTEKEGLTAVGIDDLAVRRWTTTEGLPDNTVYGILQDGFGNVWFSSNSGIYKCDAGLTRFTNYTIADGLPVNRFNYNACARIGGKLWFGSTDGIVAIDPAREGTPVGEHPIRFGSLYIYNEKQYINTHKGSALPEDLNTVGELVLRRTRLSWGVDFTCNVFDNNALNYAYRLEGMDDGWHRLGTQRRIDFTGLGFGRYRLTVCTLAPDGTPSDNSRSLAIFIRPPWWRSLAARLSYLVLALSVAGYLLWLLMNNARTRHAFELERLAREKDKEMNELKLRFFVNISHEFKTPLSLIIGPITSFLEGNVPAALREKYFNIIKRNADKLLGLINELLAFRELEHLKLRIQPFYYRPFVESALGRYTWLFESKNIRVELQEFDEGLIIWADIDKLEKMLSNLLSNACKYTPVGGHVEIGAAERDGRVYTTVTNSGPGIAPDKLPHIFERFFTGHTYDRYSSGVGLSYVKSLVELHDGAIEVESRENEYTLFIFWLPVRAGVSEVHPVDITRYNPEIFDESRLTPEIETEIEDPAYLEMERQTVVLVVDDAADMRNMVVESLRGKFCMEGVANAEQALEAIGSRRVDILVTDVMLGDGMNGFELCKAVKGNIETSHIRVILTTVLSENNYRERGYKAGADAYVVKPFEFSLLTLRIRNLIYNAWKAREAYKIDIDLSNVDITHSDSDEQWLKRAVALVFDRLSDPDFSVDDLCAGLNMSQSTLYRKLKVTAGQSANEFIQNIRLKYAARLLRETSRTVSEITFDVGFSDSSYFSRAFRKCFGVSPKQWREQVAPEKE